MKFFTMMICIALCFTTTLLFAEPMTAQDEYQKRLAEVKRLQAERADLEKQLNEELVAREAALKAAEELRSNLIKQLEEAKAQLVAKETKVPAKKAAPKNDAMTPVTDTPGLPRVLLIGDSISIDYTLPVRELLKGKANVHRVLTNCGPTKDPSKVDAWLVDKRTGGEKWDMIHFNFGLHDLKHSDDKGTIVAVTKESKRQVSPEDYEKNLREIVGKLKATGAKLIYCTTTPVPEGAKGRVPGDEVLYNEIALKVMKENNIAVDDLYAFAKPRLDKIQNKADVHFSAAGSKELATQVVSTIEEALKN
jgi:hypothetical protein